MFQSSCTSWSSKIITLGTTDSSQRTAGSLHASWYRAQNSAKLTTSFGGGSGVAGTALAGPLRAAPARRAAEKRRVTGPGSSA